MAFNLNNHVFAQAGGSGVIDLANPQPTTRLPPQAVPWLPKPAADQAFKPTPPAVPLTKTKITMTVPGMNQEMVDQKAQKIWDEMKVVMRFNTCGKFVTKAYYHPSCYLGGHECTFEFESELCTFIDGRKGCPHDSAIILPGDPLLRGIKLCKRRTVQGYQPQSEAPGFRPTPIRGFTQ
ncbi:MAG: hypothetical protein AB7K41_04280 [Bdellovibrionales bacterium]